MKIVLKGFAASLFMACSSYALGEPPPTEAGGMRFRCETENSQQRYCTVDTSEGVTLIRQLSSTPCMQGRNWDYDRHGVWVSHRCGAEFITGKPLAVGQRQALGSLLKCESRGSQIEYCAADVRKGVRLSRQLSSSDCVENRDWGHDDQGVWVARGCRAEFRVGGEVAAGQSAITPSTTIACASSDRKRQRCDVEVKAGVDLLRQLSRTRCIRERNWGWDSGGIWVDHGCRAEFSVH